MLASASLWSPYCQHRDNCVLLYKYWDLLTANSPNKNSLSLMRSNLIGHTIFLTSEKYRRTNSPKPNPHSTRYDLRAFQSGFLYFGGVVRSNWSRVNVCNVPCFPRIMASGFADNLSRTKKTKLQERKLNRMLLYLRNFRRWGTSQDLQKKFSRRSWVRDFFVFCGQLTVILGYKHL